MIDRLIKRPDQSFILLGQRGCGKSTWIKSVFAEKESLYLDLLDIKLFRELLRNPENLEAIINSVRKKWIIIDEFQKIPDLLNVVHRLIESTSLKFALTGSSARKLKRGRSNMLAGRAFYYNLYSLTSVEAQGKISDDDLLAWGGLPRVHFLKKKEEKIDYLNAYTNLYVREEIQMEQLVRKIDPFYAFLEVAAQMNGKILNFSKISADIGVDNKTIMTYFQILTETMIGSYIPAFHRSIRKRQSMAPKFYFYDVGVLRALDGSLDLKLKSGTSEYGRIFESFLISEVIKLNAYTKSHYSLSYFGSDHGEIDLILEKKGSKTILIEIKSKDKVSEDDVKNLAKYSDSIALNGNHRRYLLSNDQRSYQFAGIDFLFWKTGLARIFHGIH